MNATTLSYDPEWGSQGPQAGEIDDVLEAAYDRGRARFWAQHQADGTFRVLPSYEGPPVAPGGQLPDDWVQLTFLCTNPDYSA
jgi:hypothetical protein